MKRIAVQSLEELVDEFAIDEIFKETFKLAEKGEDVEGFTPNKNVERNNKKSEEIL